MKLGIIGQKIGMTQIYQENGAQVPVTVLDTSECRVAQVKTQEKEGYSALQLAYGEKKPQNVSKPRAGHFRKAGFAAKANLQEIRLENDEQIGSLKAGDELVASKIFAKGDRVDVVGVSKGKGYQGVMKRHNYHGGKASHGVHEYYRHGGSIGATTHPGRVIKNVGMPGQMGDEQVTVQNLEVVDVKDHLVLIKGSVPGPKSKHILIRAAAKKPAPADKSWN